MKDHVKGTCFFALKLAIKDIKASVDLCMLFPLAFGVRQHRQLLNVYDDYIYLFKKALVVDILVFFFFFKFADKIAPYIFSKDLVTYYVYSLHLRKLSLNMT